MPHGGWVVLQCSMQQLMYLLQRQQVGQDVVHWPGHPGLVPPLCSHLGVSLGVPGYIPNSILQPSDTACLVCGSGVQISSPPGNSLDQNQQLHT